MPVPAPVRGRVGVPGVEVGVPRVGRPGDHVRRPDPDLLVAARAAVGLAGGGAGEWPDDPVTIGGLLDRFGPAGRLGSPRRALRLAPGQPSATRVVPETAAGLA